MKAAGITNDTRLLNDLRYLIDHPECGMSSTYHDAGSCWELINFAVDQLRACGWPNLATVESDLLAACKKLVSADDSESKDMIVDAILTARTAIAKAEKKA